eukprot:gene18906-24709_t
MNLTDLEHATLELWAKKFGFTATLGFICLTCSRKKSQHLTVRGIITSIFHEGMPIGKPFFISRGFLGQNSRDTMSSLQQGSGQAEAFERLNKSPNRIALISSISTNKLNDDNNKNETEKSMNTVSLADALGHSFCGLLVCRTLDPAMESPVLSAYAYKLMIFFIPASGGKNAIVLSTVTKHGPYFTLLICICVMATCPNLPDRVRRGSPVAEVYGLEAPWANDHHKNFNRTSICGVDSPCLKVEQKFGELHYSVGPPYLVERSDLVRITNSWTKFVPRVYEKYPELLAEMYAYSMAAAHENLPHTILTSYMISNTDMDEEGWKYIDELKDDELPISLGNLTYKNRDGEIIEISEKKARRDSFIPVCPPIPNVNPNL